MYVSVTGLKTNNFISSLRFWFLTVPAFRGAQKADGILVCNTISRTGYHHTLTVWESKKQMLAYRKSPAHLKAMKVFPSIAIGKVYGYDSDVIPSWEDALSEWNKNARVV